MLDKNILAVKGVGQKTAALLNKLKITTIEELLKHYPVKYEEYKAPSALDNTAINNISASVCLYGTLTQKITQTVSNKYTISSSLISNQDKSQLRLRFALASVKLLIEIGRASCRERV